MITRIPCHLLVPVTVGVAELVHGGQLLRQTIVHFSCSFLHYSFLFYSVLIMNLPSRARAFLWRLWCFFLEWKNGCVNETCVSVLGVAVGLCNSLSTLLRPRLPSHSLTTFSPDSLSIFSRHILICFSSISL